MVRRAAARGDANIVLRNVLWLLKQDVASWQSFERHLNAVFHDVRVDVAFDPDNDETITATVARNGLRLPIDSSGTGVLQAIQVLAYVGLYRPRLLILDEPDSHLHPDNQRKLARYLAQVAEAEDFQVLLATHSRHLLDEMHALGAEVHWLSSGALRSGTFDTAEALLDLGALDAGDRLRGGTTRAVVLTEDARPDVLRAILESSGWADDSYQLWSYAGCTAIGAARALGAFIRSEAPGVLVVVHLDRDYMDEDEVADKTRALEETGLHPFVTAGTDIESHLLGLDHLLSVFPEIPPADLSDKLDRATAATMEYSVKCLINHRVERNNARRKRDGEDAPSAGAVAIEAPKLYSEDVARWRHGKKTLRVLRSLIQAEDGTNRKIEVASSGLRVEALAQLAAVAERGSASEADQLNDDGVVGGDSAPVP